MNKAEFLSHPNQPAVSIILPTYNRIDTIRRAIKSVLDQSFQDWELIIIDDGSSDGTFERIQGLDPRISITRQSNAGVAAARNTGLSLARANYITFLDSDDAWYPHYLSLTTRFLSENPDQHFVTTEFHQDNGNGILIRHNHDDIRQNVKAAQALGSEGYDLPAGETDPYLRIYSKRNKIPQTITDFARIQPKEDIHIYQGNIFKAMRWSYLNWLPITMITRHALEKVGHFSTETRSAEDYFFLGKIAQNFQANMIGLPCAIKYEKNTTGSHLTEDHLATGRNAYSFELNKLFQFDQLFSSEIKTDKYLQLIRRRNEIFAGLCAARAGMRSTAISHLKNSSIWHGGLWYSNVLLAFLRIIPSASLTAKSLNIFFRAQELIENVSRPRSSASATGQTMKKEEA